MTCTFFGHANAPIEIREQLKETIIKLITERDTDRFYVGNHGNFDKMVLSVLKEISTAYPQIDYCVVYAYLPKECDFVHTVYPEGIETVPKRFAIEFRNKWMIKQSDIVVTYIQHSFGGAAKFRDIAEKQGREILNIK